MSCSIPDQIVQDVARDSFRSAEYPDPGPQWPSEIQVLHDVIDDRLEKTFAGGAK